MLRLLKTTRCCRIVSSSNPKGLLRELGGVYGIFPRHCERSEAIHFRLMRGAMDCFAAQ